MSVGKNPVAESHQTGLNVHIYPSLIVHESRMFKETAALARWGIFTSIWLIGICGEGLPSEERLDGCRTIKRISRDAPHWLRSSSLRKAWSLIAWSLRVYKAVPRTQVACINCHSLPVLPLCVLLKWKTKARLIYDTHELETETNGLSGSRKILSRVIERGLYRHVDATIVVGQQIAEWYALKYGRGEPTVVLNCPERRALTRTTRIRDDLRLPEGSIIFLYQGLLAAGRGVDLLLEAFGKISDPTRVLVLMGMGPLKASIEAKQAAQSNVRYLPPALPNEVIDFTSSADVGLCLMQDSCLSHRLSMPNKLFEYMAAGVPAIVSNLPEIRRVIDESNAGWVVSSWSVDALVELIMAISREDIASRGQGAQTAGGLYTWANQLGALRSVYQKCSW